jgi:hypothetical protein
MNYPTPASGAAQDRLCELMDICRPHVHIGLEVRAELRRALLELYHLRGASQPAPQPALSAVPAKEIVDSPENTDHIDWGLLAEERLGQRAPSNWI